ncbi:sugar transferase [Macellibacteroides fermentans]|uniref:sugar transferase n=1 Tax=Macellibacteroides fermentans TaxID=879969 RepID=UPI00406C3187
MYIHFLKRLFDLIVALCALPFLIIAICIIGPIIYFDDKGPIFYKAQRIAKGGKAFSMLKFRSMKVNAPDIRLADGSTYNGDDDPRVTKVGKFMRNTSMDEIPQFLNVLIGDMSLIGIRPDPLDWLDVYNEREKVILTVKPGITGYNQAYYRNSADGALKLKNDVYYAEHISFWLDCKIVLRTIKTVLFNENVNIDEERK